MDFKRRKAIREWYILGHTVEEVCRLADQKFQMKVTQTLEMLGGIRAGLQEFLSRGREEHAALQAERILGSIRETMADRDWGSQASLERVLAKILGTEQPAMLEVKMAVLQVDPSAAAIHEKLLELGSARDGRVAKAHAIVDGTGSAVVSRAMVAAEAVTPKSEVSEAGGSFYELVGDEA